MTRAARPLVLLGVVAGLAGGSSAGSPAEKASGPPPAEKAGSTPASSGQQDVRDTHQRIERIYQRLGIEQQTESSGGCSCGEPKKDRKSESKPERRSVSMPPFLGYLLLGLVFAAMMVPVILALRSGYREVPREQEEEEERADGGAAVASRLPWKVDLSECQRLAEQGHLDRAFAALHRVTLLELERRGQLSLDEATTNWAYVRRLSSKPTLRRLLASVTEAAERSVLGRSPPGIDLYRQLAREVQGGIGG